MPLRPDRQSRRDLLAALLLWAIVIGTAGVLLVPTWFKQPKAPPPVLPQNETREQIYNLPCNLKGPGDSEAEWNVVRRRQSLVELTHPVRYVIASQAYNIPWGYISGRPFADRFHCLPRKSTSLQYWIPSLDIPVRDMIYVGTTNRPMEEGKPDRRPEESVIHVFWIVGYEEDPENRRHMLEYLVETRHLDGSAPGSAAQYGLWYTTVPEGSLQTTYWYKLGDREDAVFECYGAVQRCDGHLNLKDLRIYARLIFDKNAVPQHKVIVEGLRTLLSRWRVQT